MRRVSLVFLFIAMAAMCAWAQQSLADAARKARAEKKAEPAQHVYTNDDIATPAEKAEDAAAPATTDSKDASAKPSADAKPDADKEKAVPAEKKPTKEDAQKAAAAWKLKIAEQQKAIAEQDHEINIMEREHQIKVAEYYADAGRQLRAPGLWAQDEKKYQDDLETKKQSLADAKAKLADLQEQARKAGIPES